MWSPVSLSPCEVHGVLMWISLGPSACWPQHPRLGAREETTPATASPALCPHLFLQEALFSGCHSPGSDSLPPPQASVSQPFTHSRSDGHRKWRWASRCLCSIELSLMKIKSHQGWIPNTSQTCTISLAHCYRRHSTPLLSDACSFVRLPSFLLGWRLVDLTSPWILSQSSHYSQLPTSVWC